MSPPMQTPALLLRASDRGDDDRWLSLLTPRLGRIHALARHARGSKRRFAGALQPFVLTDLALRSRGGLFFVEEARAVEFPLGPEPGLDALAAAWLFVDLAEELCAQGHEQEAFFELMLGGLRRVGQGAENLGALRLSVLWSALALEGWAPDLELCARCGDPAPWPRLSMQASQGGLLCPQCSPAGLAGQDAATHQAWRDAAAGRPQGAPPAGAEAALLAWVEHQIGRPLRSLKVDLRTGGTP
jgi:DNA repair protein RecO (recombination protein O)